VTLAINRVHNLPHHLSYVSTLPDITQKPKIYCFPIYSASGSEKNQFGV